MNQPLQVEHILNPILATLDALPKLHSSDAHIGAWIDSTFGGPNALTKSILADFFKSVPRLNQWTARH
eukprot:scaffold240392_cov33-Tisochrysis_lutea.AAC.4